ncbi:MAG: hypothetical protein FJ319_11980 [SAR202 cluster bacterium]|nr:hypothetical protein [SAR202 cluster bacterium]
MLTITEAAKAQLKAILETRNLPKGRYLKLATPPDWIGEGDFGVVISPEKGGEQFIEYEGTTVLLIDPGLVENLEKTDAVFDYKEGPEGARFTLDMH